MFLLALLLHVSSFFPSRFFFLLSLSMFLLSLIVHISSFSPSPCFFVFSFSKFPLALLVGFIYKFICFPSSFSLLSFAFWCPLSPFSTSLLFFLLPISPYIFPLYHQFFIKSYFLHLKISRSFLFFTRFISSLSLSLSLLKLFSCLLLPISLFIYIYTYIISPHVSLFLQLPYVSYSKPHFLLFHTHAPECHT